MQNDKINYTAVGIFVLAMLILLLVVLFRLTGKNTNTDIYHTIFSNVAGVRSGSPVTYGGFHIGQIDAINPLHRNKQTQYQLKLAIRTDWKIPEDSVASIVQPGLLSESQIDIREGESPQLLNIGDIIPSQDATGLLALLDGFSTDLKPLLNNLSKLSVDLHDQLPQIANNLNTLLVKLNTSADNINTLTNKKQQAEIYSLLENANKASETILNLIEQYTAAGQQLETLFASSENIVDTNKDDIKQSIVNLRDAMDALSENMSSIIHNLDTASRNMNEFTRKIRENPGALLGGEAPKDKVKVE